MNMYFPYTYTAWKVSVFGIILVHIFPHLDWTWRDNPHLSISSPNTGKCRTKQPQIPTLFRQWYIYMYLCIYMYIYANNVNICIHIYLSIPILCIYIRYVYLCIYVHTNIYNTDIYTYIYIIHIYVYIERYICRYMYTWDYTGNNKNIRFHVTK